MKSLSIREIIKTEDGHVSIIHSDGAFHYNEKDVLLIEWHNDFYSRLIVTGWAKYFFWNSVLGSGLGITMLLLGMLNRNKNIRGDLLNDVFNNVHYLLISFFLSYFFIRIIYFLLERNNFEKSLLSISLKNNIRVLFKDSNERIRVTLNKKNVILPGGDGALIGKLIENDWRSTYRIKKVFDYIPEQNYQSSNLLFHHFIAVVFISFGAYQFVQDLPIDQNFSFFDRSTSFLNLFVHGYVLVSIIFLFFIISMLFMLGVIISVFTTYTIGYLILYLMLFFKVNGSSIILKIERIENRALRIVISLVTGLFFISTTVFFGNKIGFLYMKGPFHMLYVALIGVILISFFEFVYRNQKMRTHVEKLLSRLLTITSRSEKNGTLGLNFIPMLLVNIIFIRTLNGLKIDVKKEN